MVGYRCCGGWFVRPRSTGACCCRLLTHGKNTGFSRCPRGRGKLWGRFWEQRLQSPQFQRFARVQAQRLQSASPALVPSKNRAQPNLLRSVRQASRVGGRQRKGTTNRPFRDAVLNLSADRSEHFGECDNVLCFWRGTCLWQGFGPLDSAPPVSDGERGQAGVVPRWFVTSDGRIRHVEMRLQWTCLAVWFLGCSVQEC